MSNQYKYIEYLFNLEDGDILFTRGSSFLARVIQIVDKCKYNHCGIIYKDSDGTPMVLEALGQGVTPTKLRDRIGVNLDFTVYRPNKVTYSALAEVMSSRKGVKYDVWLLPKIGLARILRFTGLNWFKSDNTASKDICSETVRHYTDALGLEEYSAKGMREKTGKEWVTPMDFIRYNKNLTHII